MDELFVDTTATGTGASTIGKRILRASDILPDIDSSDESSRTDDDNSSTEQVILPVKAKIKTRKRKRSVSPKVFIYLNYFHHVFMNIY